MRSNQGFSFNNSIQQVTPLVFKKVNKNMKVVLNSKKRMKLYCEKQRNRGNKNYKFFLQSSWVTPEAGQYHRPFSWVCPVFLLLSWPHTLHVQWYFSFASLFRGGSPFDTRSSSSCAALFSLQARCLGWDGRLSGGACCTGGASGDGGACGGGGVCCGGGGQLNGGAQLNEGPYINGGAFGNGNCGNGGACCN